MKNNAKITKSILRKQLNSELKPQI